MKGVESRYGRENQALILLFFESYLDLLLDSPIDSGKPIRLLRKFLAELLNGDLKELIIRYSSYADAILESMSVTSDYTITGEFLDEMKGTPIFREYLHFYRTGDAACLQFILSFLYFGKKMDYVDLDLETSAFRSWLDIERRLDNLVIPPELTSLMSTIVKQLVPTVDDSIFLGHHGPGSTAEGFLDPNEKLDNFSIDAKARYAFRGTSFGRTQTNRISPDLLRSGGEKEQVAKLRFVPKNIKTMRSICMEPISRMYLQQEVARWLVNAMEDGPLRRVVTLQDQSRNQHYAACGSYSQSCDTIDLSAASDRIHVDLVRKVFPAKVLYYLMGTRTDAVSTTDGMVKLNKFAPMGSALCFPVQCIMFSTIALIAYLMQHYDVDKWEDVPKDGYYVHNIGKFLRLMHTEPEELDLHRLLLPTVYGDDIVCDYRTTNDILILLELCGLTVNSEKSFIGGSPFRESCGIFAYLGEEVTPLLFRIPSHFFARGGTNPHLNAKVMASLFDSANRAGDKNYRRVRSCYINYVKRSSADGIRGELSPYIPFTSSRDQFGIFTLNPHRPKVIRVNRDYQREEKRAMVLRQNFSNRYVSTHMERYAFDQWMRARIRGGSDENTYSSSRIRPRDTRVKLGWTPV